jgi:hypothetical protein
VAYDVQLASRARKMFADDLAVREQAMFGELAFLVAGRVAVAASADGGLLVRVEAARAPSKNPGPKPLPQHGRSICYLGGMSVAT